MVKYLLLTLILHANFYADLQILHEHGAVSLSPATDRVPAQTQLKTGTGALLIGRLQSDAMLKVLDEGSLYLRSSPSQGMEVITLVFGQMLLNMASEPGTEHIVETAYGEFRSDHGDFGFNLDLTHERLEISCLDGLGVLRVGILEYSLAAGEQIVLQHGKIYPKTYLTGAQARQMYVWYRQGHAWPLPEYFANLGPGTRDTDPKLSTLIIQGLDVLPQGLQGRVFGLGDLVLGMIRIEGRVQNLLPHQIVQVSLNGGINWQDTQGHDEFIFKAAPVEGEFEVKFRLRDDLRHYVLDHPGLVFSYVADSGSGRVKGFLEELRRAYERADSAGLYKLLKSNRSYPASIYEEIIAGVSRESIRRLQLELLAVVSRAGFLTAEVRFVRISTARNAILPVRDTGIWRPVFQEDKQAHLQLIASRGDDPLSLASPTRGGDRTGPRLVASQRVNVDPLAGLSLAISCEDEASPVDQIEYFLRSPGAAGTGTPIPCDDGRCDEKKETATLRVRVPAGVRRLFLRARDRAGNWGHVHSVLLD